MNSRIYRFLSAKHNYDISSLLKKSIVIDFGKTHESVTYDKKIPFDLPFDSILAFLSSGVKDTDKHMHLAILASKQKHKDYNIKFILFIYSPNKKQYLYAGVGWFNLEVGYGFSTTQLMDTAGKSLILLVRSCQALKCNNVKLEKQIQKKKARRRAKNNNLPLLSVYTLHINSNERTDGKKYGGTHAPPRVHLRRGHIREYKPGKYTWVQPCVVGNKKLGMIHKYYAVSL